MKSLSNSQTNFGDGDILCPRIAANDIITITAKMWLHRIGPKEFQSAASIVICLDKHKIKSGESIAKPKGVFSCLRLSQVGSAEAGF
jgi:hypothetical protein